MNSRMSAFPFLFCFAFPVFMVSGFSGTLPMLSFDEGYSQLFGEANLMVLNDGKSVHISLDDKTGSGFVSQEVYLHGYFSASIKLPADYTAGVVVAFYISNGDKYEKNHDEIDFEFLGNIRGKYWRIQTNIYGNGSTSMGREERYGLWFDPSEDFHQYSILWTENVIVFYVDNVPIREVKRTEAMGGDFPSKPMSLYATIWDASDWATNGGSYRVNYKYAPFIAEYSDFILDGCAVDPTGDQTRCEDPREAGPLPVGVTREQRVRMAELRMRQMQYSYCYDRARYKFPPPECILDPNEGNRLRGFDPVTFGGARTRRHHRNRRARARASSM